MKGGERMNVNRLMTRTFLIGPILAILISAGVLVSYGGNTGEGHDSGGGEVAKGFRY